MAGGEGEAVLRGCADSLPPLFEKLDRLKRARPRYHVFQYNIRYQRAAAYRAENAHAEFPCARKAQAHEREQEKYKTLFPDKRDKLHQRGQHDAEL